MAQNYEQTASQVIASLAASSLSSVTKEAIQTAIGTGGNVVITTTVTNAGLQGAKIAETAGGVIDLSKASASDIAALEAIIVTGEESANITIKNNNFDGTVVLGAGDGTVNLATNKAVKVETGMGDDKITTGSGQDSVVVSAGDDSINTGAGNDKVSIKDGFVGKAVLDGGTGTNTLQFDDGVKNVTVNSSGQLVFTMDNTAPGHKSTITAKNFNAIVLGDDGSSVNLKASKKALNLTTGKGDDSVVLGSGKDSIVLGGGKDTIDTGAGVDKVDLSLLAIRDAVKGSANQVNVTLKDGTVLSITNAENFVYDSNGADEGGIVTVGLTTLDTFEF